MPLAHPRWPTRAGPPVLAHPCWPTRAGPTVAGLTPRGLTTVAGLTPRGSDHRRQVRPRVRRTPAPAPRLLSATNRLSRSATTHRGWSSDHRPRHTSLAPPLLLLCIRISTSW